jgi:hypothetical protein
MQSMRHRCGEFGCLGKFDDPEGIAIAGVLDGRGTQNGAQSQIIRQWMNVNEGLMIGEQTLRAWLKDIITKAYNMRHSSNGDGGTPRLCSLSTEVDHLSQAFDMMEKYRMRLAITDKGMFKLVYCEAQVGDAISRIDHCILPVVLRPLHKRPWVVQSGMLSDEPESLPPTQEETGRKRSDSIQDTPPNLPAHAVGTAPDYQQYTYIGESFRFEYGTAQWADSPYTGWQAKHFAPERWTDLRIV